MISKRVLLSTILITLAVILTAAMISVSGGFDSVPQHSQLKARALAPDGPLAFETRHGTIITDDESKARWADERLQSAVASFIRNFGTAPGRGVIIELPYVSYAKAIPKAQRRWTLPWMSRYFGSGDAVKAGPGGHHFDNDSGMQHELNHLFFTAGVVPSTKPSQYGGDAPDWLDEAAALTAESPEAKARRRADFRRQVCAGRLVPLERFIVQRHPLIASPAMQKFIAERRAAAKGTPTMMTIGANQLGVPQHALQDFYAQSAAVAEFVAEISGDPRILSRIAQSATAASDRPNERYPSWTDDLTVGDQPLGTQFATWARASVRAGGPGCAASRIVN
ncbi:hypothetical protein [uncultured Sphingomonas sp.]|uniref:hypothetical protein n=1 Tax=uncultured Sphingomonas sp. TaxID=158754 RepID=UPI0035CAF93D